jgi:peroxiredoxin Q/BCP
VEGQALRDRAADFRRLDCVVLGASFDTPEENRAFARAQEFNFPLLSDVDHRVGLAYEVTRAGDDQYHSFPLRISYLIDRDGVIRRVYTVADVAGHAARVLDDLAVLGSAS